MKILRSFPKRTVLDADQKPTPSDREKLEYLITTFSEGYERSAHAIRLGDRTLHFGLDGNVSKITFHDGTGAVVGTVYP